MKTPTIVSPPAPANPQQDAPRFATLAEFLAAEKTRFQQVFGEVDWNQVKQQVGSKPAS